MGASPEHFAEWERQTRTFIAKAEATGNLDLVESGKVLLLYGMNLYRKSRAGLLDEEEIQIGVAELKRKSNAIRRIAKKRDKDG